MGRFFSLTFDAVDTGAAADTFKTIAALIAADTAGFRCRLRSLSIGCSEDAPVDEPMAVQLKRVSDVSAGGAGTADSNPTPAPRDTLQVASIITTGEDYITGGVEPTAYATEPVWAFEFNLRNSFIKHWEPDDAPIINRDQLLGLLATPRNATARELSGTLEFEEF